MARSSLLRVARLGPTFLVTITASDLRELINHNQGGAARVRPERQTFRRAPVEDRWRRRSHVQDQLPATSAARKASFDDFQVMRHSWLATENISVFP